MRSWISTGLVFTLIVPVTGCTTVVMGDGQGGATTTAASSSSSTGIAGSSSASSASTGGDGGAPASSSGGGNGGNPSSSTASGLGGAGGAGGAGGDQAASVSSGVGGAASSSGSSGGGGASSASSGTSSSSSSGSGGGPVGCPAAPGGSVLWTTQAPTDPDTITPGRLTTTQGGDIVFGKLLTDQNQHQHVGFHHFSPLGVHLKWIYGYGTDPHHPDSLGVPNDFTVDPLGNLLFSHVSLSNSTTYYSSYGFANKVTLAGQTLQSVSALWNAVWEYEFHPSQMAGDSAGRLVVDAVIQPQCDGCDPGGAGGLNFGNGVERGALLLRWDAAKKYLGSLPHVNGDWRADNDGNRYSFGGVTSPADVGCGVVSDSNGLNPTLIVKRDFDGNCLWSKFYPTPHNFTVGADQQVALVYNHTGALDLGSGPLPYSGAQNLTIARLDPAGNLIMTKTFGGPSSAIWGGLIDVNTAGYILVQGYFSGTVDLGGGPLDGAAGASFIAVFDPSGAFRWSRVVTVGPPDATGQGGWLRTAIQPCGVVLGTTSSTVDLGSGPIVAPQMGALSPNTAIAGLAL